MTDNTTTNATAEWRYAVQALNHLDAQKEATLNALSAAERAYHESDASEAAKAAVQAAEVAYEAAAEAYSRQRDAMMLMPAPHRAALEWKISAFIESAMGTAPSNEIAQLRADMALLVRPCERGARMGNAAQRIRALTGAMDGGLESMGLLVAGLSNADPWVRTTTDNLCVWSDMIAELAASIEAEAQALEVS